MVRSFCFGFLIMPAMALGQTEFGIKGGLNVSDIVMTNYVNPDVESDLALKAGLHAGFFVTGSVNERIGIAGELLYSNKGVKAISNIHLHYITLPLLLEYQLSKTILAEIGPELGYMFSAISKYGSAANTYDNKVDLALDAGVCVDGRRMTFGMRYCVGMFSVREPIASGGSFNEKIKYQNRVLQFFIGYKLWTLE